MRKKIVRRRRPLALASLLLAAAAVAATTLLLGGGTAAAQGTVNCFVTTDTDQAEHRLQLNTVTLTPSPSDPLAKTVAMEKDIYQCFEGNTRVGFRDLETFVEIVERTATPSTPTVVTVDRRVEVAACDKTFATGVKCTTKTVPLGPPVANPFPTDCRPQSDFPPDVQMNTVALGTNQVKTIKVDKEVFFCGDTAATITYLDVYVFSEILERLTSAQDNIKPYAKPFDGIACLRDIDAPSPTVTSCTRFTTS